eukprot:scaffold287_cov337-Pavlova_lutheri.AAC.147
MDRGWTAWTVCLFGHGHRSDRLGSFLLSRSSPLGSNRAGNISQRPGSIGDRTGNRTGFEPEIPPASNPGDFGSDRYGGGGTAETNMTRRGAPGKPS